MNILPVPITQERPWAVFASCKEVESELFFPPEDGDVRPAKMICGSCPVRPECLDWAIEANMTAGIWGGLTARERLQLRRSA